MKRTVLTMSPVFWLLIGACYAQQDRIAAPIDADQKVILRGHVHQKARPEFDLGPVEASFRIPAVTLLLKQSASQRAALQQLLDEQQDPSSPNYHRWLTPEQYAERFGLSQNDIDKIVSWLESGGLKVQTVARSRTWIVFDGAAERVQAAFHTEIHRYRIDGRESFANATDPSIPEALDLVVGGFLGLDDFRPRPPRSSRHLVPNLTSTTTSHYLTPTDIATIYDLTPLYEAGVDGSQQKIVILGQSDINLSDFETFRSTYGLTAQLPQLVLFGSDPGIEEGFQNEAEIDLEWAGAVARNATLIYVYSNDELAAARYAVDRNLAPVMSMSLSACEQSQTTVALSSYRTLAQQANSQGITWLVASGDSGAAGCDLQGSNIAQNGLAVSYLASVPEVTAVGGTEFNEQGGTYWSSANPSLALAYIPEVGWNDVGVSGGLWATGGGASSVYPKPSWQTGPGVPNDGFRDVPDVALTASSYHDSYLTEIGGSSEAVGGTSISTPCFAGIVALLNQYLVSTHVQVQPGLGNINPMLYRLAQSTTGIFHDITTGSNVVPCAVGTPNCASGSLGYNAGPGYDGVTGLGSVDANNLIKGLKPPVTSSVVSSVNPNPVDEQEPDASGLRWHFTLTLTEEAGFATTITNFTFNGASNPALILDYFGTATIPAHGTVSSPEIGYATLDVPQTISFGITGMDASGYTWSQQLSITFYGPQAPVAVSGMTNAASFQQAFAPGMIASVFGAQLGSSTQAASTVPLPQYMAGFAAGVNGVNAPPYYVSPSQVNFQVPYETAVGQAELWIQSGGRAVQYSFQVAASAPGIFTDQSKAIVPSSTGSRGQILTFYMTGAGQVSPPVATGSAPSPSTPISELPAPTLPVTVSLAGMQAPIQFIGVPSWAVGVVQINFQVPVSSPLGSQPVVVTVGGVASPPANVTVTPQESTPTSTPVNLAGSFNHTGIYPDGVSFSSTGGLDGSGFAYSGNLLGSSQTWNGVVFNLGSTGAANAISCVGSTISLPAGKYSSLELLATGVYGSQVASFTVLYTDGSTARFTQSLSDWAFPQGYAGESNLLRMSYRDAHDGTRDDLPVYLYGYSFALNNAKTVSGLTLPNNSYVEALAVTLVP